MIEAIRPGLVENVPIDGVGKVFWTPRVVNEHIAPPSPSASRLFLYLDAPFRSGGFESVQLVKYQTGVEALHTSSDIMGATEPPRFPGWFMNFTLDLQDWTQAEAVDCINNANDYGPDEIEFRIANAHAWDGYAVYDPDIFLWRFAGRLASFAATPQAA